MARYSYIYKIYFMLSKIESLENIFWILMNMIILKPNGFSPIAFNNPVFNLVL